MYLVRLRKTCQENFVNIEKGLEDLKAVRNVLKRIEDIPTHNTEEIHIIYYESKRELKLKGLI